MKRLNEGEDFRLEPDLSFITLHVLLHSYITVVPFLGCSCSPYSTALYKNNKKFLLKLNETFPQKLKRKNQIENKEMN